MVQGWKKQEVEEIKELVENNSIFGIVDLENLPTLQYQRIRKGLKNVKIKMVKKRLIKIALDQLKDKKKNIEQISEKIKGMPALIFTEDNPFKLYKEIDRNKSKAFAKAGQVAPGDIIVPGGPTPFAPGPIIGELGSFGIKTEVKEGKVAVKEKKLLVKEGELINGKVAGLLQQLGIEPMEVGLNLIVVYENGIIFDKKILEVDEKEYVTNLQLLHNEAFNLSIVISYVNKDNIRLLLRRAFRESILLMDSQNIITNENIKKIIGKVDKEINYLKEKLNLQDKTGIKEEKKEAKVEDKKEEIKEKSVEEKKEVKEETKEDVELRTNSYNEYKKKKDMTTEKLLKEDEGG